MIKSLLESHRLDDGAGYAIRERAGKDVDGGDRTYLRVVRTTNREQRQVDAAEESMDILISNLQSRDARHGRNIGGSGVTLRMYDESGDPVVGDTGRADETAVSRRGLSFLTSYGMRANANYGGHDPAFRWDRRQLARFGLLRALSDMESRGAILSVEVGDRRMSLSTELVLEAKRRIEVPGTQRDIAEEQKDKTIKWLLDSPALANKNTGQVEFTLGELLTTDWTPVSDAPAGYMSASEAREMSDLGARYERGRDIPVRLRQAQALLRQLTELPVRLYNLRDGVDDVRAAELMEMDRFGKLTEAILDSDVPHGAKNRAIQHLANAVEYARRRPTWSNWTGDVTLAAEVETVLKGLSDSEKTFEAARKRFSNAAAAADALDSEERDASREPLSEESRRLWDKKIGDSRTRVQEADAALARASEVRRVVADDELGLLREALATARESAQKREAFRTEGAAAARLVDVTAEFLDARTREDPDSETDSLATVRAKLDAARETALEAAALWAEGAEGARTERVRELTAKLLKDRANAGHIVMSLPLGSKAREAVAWIALADTGSAYLRGTYALEDIHSQMGEAAVETATSEARSQLEPEDKPGVGDVEASLFPDVQQQLFWNRLPQVKRAAQAYEAAERNLTRARDGLVVARDLRQMARAVLAQAPGERAIAAETDRTAKAGMREARVEAEKFDRAAANRYAYAATAHKAANAAMNDGAAMALPYNHADVRQEIDAAGWPRRWEAAIEGGVTVERESERAIIAAEVRREKQDRLRAADIERARGRVGETGGRDKFEAAVKVRKAAWRRNTLALQAAIDAAKVHGAPSRRHATPFDLLRRVDAAKAEDTLADITSIEGPAKPIEQPLPSIRRMLEPGAFRDPLPASRAFPATRSFDPTKAGVRLHQPIGFNAWNADLLALISTFKRFMGKNLMPVDIVMATDTDMRAYMRDAGIADRGSMEVLTRFAENVSSGQTMGLHVALRTAGKPHSLILVRPPRGPKLQSQVENLAIIGHELGHALARAELEGLFEYPYPGESSLYGAKATTEGKRLISAYLADRERYLKASGNEGQYSETVGGFEEWYADKLAAHMLEGTSEPRPPAGVGDSPAVRRYFQQAAAHIRSFFEAIRTQMGPFGQRFEPSDEFRKYAESLRERFRDPTLGAGPKEGMSAGLAHEIGEAMALKVDKEVGVRAARKLRDAWRGDGLAAMKRIVTPASVRLWHLSPALAGFFRGRAGTTEPIGWSDAHVMGARRAFHEIERLFGLSPTARWSDMEGTEMETALKLAENENWDHDEHERNWGTEGVDRDVGAKARNVRRILERKQTEIFRSEWEMIREHAPIPEELEGATEARIAAYWDARMKNHFARRVASTRRNFFPRRLSLIQLQRSTLARERMIRLAMAHVKRDEDSDAPRPMTRKEAEGHGSRDPGRRRDVGRRGRGRGRRVLAGHEAAPQAAAVRDPDVGAARGRAAGGPPADAAAVPVASGRTHRVQQARRQLRPVPGDGAAAAGAPVGGRARHARDLRPHRPEHLAGVLGVQQLRPGGDQLHGPVHDAAVVAGGPGVLDGAGRRRPGRRAPVLPASRPEADVQGERGAVPDAGDHHVGRAEPDVHDRRGHGLRQRRHQAGAEHVLPLDRRRAPEPVRPDDGRGDGPREHPERRGRSGGGQEQAVFDRAVLGSAGGRGRGGRDGVGRGRQADRRQPVPGDRGRHAQVRAGVHDQSDAVHQAGAGQRSAVRVGLHADAVLLRLRREDHGRHGPRAPQAGARGQQLGRSRPAAAVLAGRHRRAGRAGPRAARDDKVGGQVRSRRRGVRFHAAGRHLVPERRYGSRGVRDRGGRQGRTVRSVHAGGQRVRRDRPRRQPPGRADTDRGDVLRHRVRRRHRPRDTRGEQSMSILSFPRFRGINHALNTEDLPIGSAVDADNCLLRSGEIRPLNESAQTPDSLPDGDRETIFRYRPTDRALSDVWLSWAIKGIRALPGPLPDDAYDRVYWTGDGHPRMADYDAVTVGGADYPNASYRLGVPAPPNGLAARIGGVSSGVDERPGFGGAGVGYVYNGRKAETAADIGNGGDHYFGTADGMNGVDNWDMLKAAVYCAFDTMDENDVEHVADVHRRHGEPGRSARLSEGQLPVGRMAHSDQRGGEQRRQDGPGSQRGDGRRRDVPGRRRRHRVLLLPRGGRRFAGRGVCVHAGDPVRGRRPPVRAVERSHDKRGPGGRGRVSRSTDAATISDFDERALGAGAKKRLYRANPGTLNAAFQFAGEQDLDDAGEFSDMTNNFLLGEALPSRNWTGPPDDDAALHPTGPLAGIIALPGGVFAGFSGRTVYLSEPGLPHAWPTDYRVTADSDIVALSLTVGGLVALTDGKPSLISGSHPSSMAATPIEFPQGCVNAATAVDMGGYLLYVCPDGLARIDGAGGQLASRNYLPAKDWSAAFPLGFANACAFYWEGAYVLLDRTTGSKGRWSGWWRWGS